jgi:aspartate kinase
MLIVLKFGGSSLADKEKIRRAARRIATERQNGNQVVAVVSAQGDTTDLLLKKALSLVPHPDVRELDAYLSAGEQMSAALMAMAVQELGLAAVSLAGWQAGIRTDPHHGDARVLELGNRRIRQELDQGKVVIVTGFQGICSDDITTLGRGGSDTTAVALAGLLKADLCRIYTDVDGVYDKDPRKFSDAVKFAQIDYDDMLRLARQGAQVLHDRCVEAAMMYHVPIQVLSSFRPGEGTLVTKIPKKHTQNI